MEGGFTAEFHWNISNGNEKLTACAISKCVTVHSIALFVNFYSFHL